MNSFTHFSNTFVLLQTYVPSSAFFFCSPFLPQPLVSMWSLWRIRTSSFKVWYKRGCAVAPKTLHMQIRLNVLAACCIVPVHLCHCIMEDKPVSNTVYEYTTHSSTAFLHVEVREEWEERVPPFSLFTKWYLSLVMLLAYSTSTLYVI